SRLVMAGVDIRTVQELMGHRTLAMTMRYAHLTPAHKLDAVQRLSRRRGDPVGDPGVAATRIAVEVGQQVPNLASKPSEPCWDRTSDPLLKSAIRADRDTIRHHRLSEKPRLSYCPADRRMATDVDGVRTGFGQVCDSSHRLSVVRLAWAC